MWKIHAILGSRLFDAFFVHSRVTCLYGLYKKGVLTGKLTGKCALLSAIFIKRQFLGPKPTWLQKKCLVFYCKDANQK